MHEFLVTVAVLLLCAHHPLKSNSMASASSARRLEQRSEESVLMKRNLLVSQNTTELLTSNQQTATSNLDHHMVFSQYHTYPLNLTYKLYKWGEPPGGYPLSAEMLSRSTEFEGSLVSIRSLIGRLSRSNAICSDEGMVNEEIHIMVLGGSVTGGGCAYAPCFEGQQHHTPKVPPTSNNRKSLYRTANEKCRVSWSMFFKNFLSNHYPCLKVVLANEAQEGSKLGSMQGSLTQMVESDLQGKVDLVIIDYSVNEGSETFQSERKKGYTNTILTSHESAVRTLLSMDHQPTLLYLETFGISPDWFYGQQALHREVAEHYDFPIVSYLNAVWPTKSNPMWKGTRKDCPQCRLYWSNALLKECGVHPGWYTHQLVADVLTYNFLRWERLAAPAAALPTDGASVKEGVALPPPDATATASRAPPPSPRIPLPDFYDPGAKALGAARCGKAAPDVRYDARRARAELLQAAEAAARGTVAHTWNATGPPPPAGAADAAGAAGDGGGNASLHGGRRGLRTAPRRQRKKAAGQPQKQKPGARPSPPALSAGLWGTGYGGKEQARKGRWVGSTHWQLTEDVPGKPGWVADKNSTGGRLSFYVACPGSVTVEYLRSYEHIGQAWAFFSEQPLAAAPQPPAMQRHGPQFLDVGAGLLNGKWESPTSQSHVTHLFCRPVGAALHSVSSSAGEEEPRGCFPSQGEEPSVGGGNCFSGMQSIGNNDSAGSVASTECPPTGISAEEGVGVRNGAWLNIDFSATLNGRNPWPKFKVLAVESFACAKSQVVWNDKELLRAHTYIKACSYRWF